MKFLSISSLALGVAVLFYQLWRISLLWAGYPQPLQDAESTRPSTSASASQTTQHGRTNIWRDLSHREVVDLLSWLHTPSSGLNLTPPESADRFNDFVLVTELLRPNKTDAVAFLDHGALMPPRFARVTVKRNSVAPPVVAEYVVGPLSALEELGEPSIEPLRFLYNSGRSTTVNTAADTPALSAWLKQVTTNVSDIIQDIFQTPVQLMVGVKAPTYEAFTIDQAMNENGRVVRWASFSVVSDSPSILPQGLYFKVDTTGRDPERWRVVLWLYNNITYESTADFRRAWEDPSFQKLMSNVDGSWTQLEPDSLPQYSDEHSRRAPPEAVQPGGSRIYLDEQESFVSWLDFGFNFAFSQVNGVALYDIRLDGERIMYELSLQEAMAHYAGNDPVQSNTAFLDSLYGIGTQAGALLPGYDCPQYAHFLDLSYHRMGKTYRRSGALCIFEAPTDAPLQRHARGMSFTSFTNSVLIVRTIAVVGNYDYLIDYIMYLDGTIEVKVRASGYIQGAFYLNNSGYGYHVHDALSSSIHDHVLNFKADLDITGGTRNSLARVTVAPKDVDYVWSTTGARRTMVLERSFADVETALDWPPNGATMYVVTGAENHLGELRGYRIMPGTGVGAPVHLTVQDSPILLRAAEWAKHDLFVTRQKDTEARSSVPVNALSPEDPLIDFGRFLDNESIVDQDLVVWFNLGTHHVPHTGDIPNTLMTTSASSVMFVPHNYHVRDRSRALTNGVRVDASRDGTYQATYFGPAPRPLGRFSPNPRPIRKYPAEDTDTAV